jgi:serine/threonine protein phosphatase 1
VVRWVKDKLPAMTRARIVALRGNHEDGWLRVIDRGWSEFVLPRVNGCLACLRSYRPRADIGRLFGAPSRRETLPTAGELEQLVRGTFFPADHVEWMRRLGWFYEDERGIYVHAGIPHRDGRWIHPSEVEDKQMLVWLRTREFFKSYRGKRIVVGHTTTNCLPPELSAFTPEDPTDMWEGECVLAIDTGAGKGGFLTAVELPAKTVYESRDPVAQRQEG